MFFDLINYRRQVITSFGMNRQHVRAGGTELVDVFLRAHHHQVNVQRQIGELSQSCNDGNPISEIWNKNPVHYVQVQTCDASFFQTLNFAFKVSKITL